MGEIEGGGGGYKGDVVQEGTHACTCTCLCLCVQRFLVF
jgi:hypothetical protein